MSATSTASFSEGRKDAPYTILLLHGYTGSPDGFRELAKVLSNTLDAYVSVPLLPGHGTTLDELQNIVPIINEADS